MVYFTLKFITKGVFKLEIKSDLSEVLAESMKELMNYANGDSSGVTIRKYQLPKLPLSNPMEEVQEDNE